MPDCSGVSRIWSARKGRMYAASLLEKFDCKEIVGRGGSWVQVVFTRWKDMSLFIC